MAGALQPLDKCRCFIAGELATSLALGEAHRAARVPEIAMAGFCQQAEELAHLTGRRRRPRLLAERHRTSRRWAERALPEG